MEEMQICLFVSVGSISGFSLKNTDQSTGKQKCLPPGTTGNDERFKSKGAAQDLLFFQKS